MIIFPYVTDFKPKSNRQRPLAVSCWKIWKLIVFLELLVVNIKKWVDIKEYKYVYIKLVHAC